MDEPTLESMFESYRTGGDVNALGTVFDRTAPDLWRFARRFVRSKSQADDLVQDTFLAVIESASAFDASRKLLPWMFGILVRRAIYARRQSARVVDPARLPVASDARPDTAALAAEIRANVEAALARLPAHYQEVVRARLEQDCSGPELAALFGRDPATIRTQLSRGLALLRGLLPQGLAGVALALAPRRALAGIRERVLDNAASRGLSSSIRLSAGVRGGLSMAARIALVSALVVIGTGTYFLCPGTGASAPVAAQSSDQSTPSTTETATTAAAPQRVLQTAADAAPLLGANLVGRLVDARAEAVAHVRVDLLGTTLARLTHAEGPGDLSVASATTDAEGRFTLAGARSGRLHALAIDASGPRATLHAVLMDPPVSGVLDLGTLVLSDRSAIAGRVVDAEGKPAPGARVRVLQNVVPVLPIAPLLAQWNAHARLVIGASPALVVKPAAWTLQLLDRLPWRTTSTLADGSFVLENVPRGSVTVIVDGVDACVPTSTSVVLGSSRLTLDPIVLARGATLSGRVVDAAGRPIPNAEVCAGARVEGLPATVLSVGGRCDSGGGYVLASVPGEDSFVVAARKDPASDWTTVHCDDTPATVTLSDATLHVAVAADGGARPMPTRVLVEAGDGRRDLPLTPQLVAIDDRVVPRADGLFDVVGLAPGTYRVVAEFADGRVAAARVELAKGGATVTLNVAQRTSRAVRVVDDATGAPLRDVDIECEGARSGRVLAITQVDGTIALAAPDVWDSRIVVDGKPRPTSSTTTCEVRVLRPATLDGRIHRGDAGPEAALWIVAFDRGVDGLGRVAPVREDGTFHLEGLVAGMENVEWIPRPDASDPIGVLLGLVSAFDRSIAQRRVALEPGKTATVDVDLEVAPTSATDSTRINVALDPFIAKVRVTRAESDAPCAGVRVDLALMARASGSKLLEFSAGRFSSRTGADGIASIELPCDGTYRVSVSDDDSFASVSQPLNHMHASTPLEVRLSGWRVEGTLTLEPDIDPDTIEQLRATAEDGTRYDGHVGGFIGEPLTFSFKSIPPGRLTLALRAKSGTYAPLVLDVPIGGLRDTHLRFVK